MKETLELAIAAATLLGLISTALLWYRAKVEKTYAAQRDFNHLRNSINSLSANLEKLMQQQDDLLDEIKRNQEKILTKIEVIPFGFRDLRGWAKVETDDPPTGPLR